MSAGSGQFQPRRATTEPLWLRAILLTFALGFLALFLLLPLVIVFGEAFSKGWQVYLAAITKPAAAHAIKLTLIAAVIAVPDDRQGHRLVAFVVMTDPAGLTAIAPLVVERLGGAARPEVVAVDALPMLPSGKIDRLALRTLAPGA